MFLSEEICQAALLVLRIQTSDCLLACSCHALPRVCMSASPQLLMYTDAHLLGCTSPRRGLLHGILPSVPQLYTFCLRKRYKSVMTGSASLRDGSRPSTNHMFEIVDQYLPITNIPWPELNICTVVEHKVALSSCIRYLRNFTLGWCRPSAAPMWNSIGAALRLPYHFATERLCKSLQPPFCELIPGLRLTSHCG